MRRTLRPMNLGEILDQTFEIYRERFWLFVGIAAIPALLMLSLHFADRAWLHSERLIRPGTRGESIAWNWVVSLGYYHVSSLISLLIFPAFVRASSDTLFGRNISTSASLRFAAARWRSYLWVASLKISGELVGPEVCGAGVTIAATMVLTKLNLLGGFFPMGAILLFVFVAVLYLVFWVGACLAFAIPASALEKSTGLTALRRSWGLTRGSRWRIVLAWMAVFFCVGILSIVMAGLLRGMSTLLYYRWHLHWFNLQAYYGLSNLIGTAIYSLVGPLYPIAATLLYYDQRVRKEGLDLEMMMESAGLQAAVTDRVLEPAVETDKTVPSLWSRVPRQREDGS